MIKKQDRNLGQRAYEPVHMNTVVSEIKKSFPLHFSQFKKGNEIHNALMDNPNFKVIVKSKPSSAKDVLSKAFQKSIDELTKNQPVYSKFFDMESLDEDQDDPNAFKKGLSKQISIINRCLNSKAKEMERYKSEFFSKSGREMLDVTTAIIAFGNEYARTFDERRHEAAITVGDLGLSALLEEQYVSYNVIGGGIKSNFLHTLFPNAFAYRSQNALWALWYLTGKNDFGFIDGSEFLMLDPSKGTTQQNYHYPYDLFCFYALQLYMLLKNACKYEGVLLQDKYRYIYLDTFLNSIADIEHLEINDLKKSGDYAG
ncbi:hypothetical protein AAEO56_06935 [Flavobacterium sp. DGU11]|uniref:Uncharacterized protein n=1 Tax=Flavobacterium arundinis TaxID=3139143 RepID=A0ABU9HV09_9FLAO